MLHAFPAGVSGNNTRTDDDFLQITGLAGVTVYLPLPVRFHYRWRLP